jgi:hypothetical protein
MHTASIPPSRGRVSAATRRLEVRIAHPQGVVCRTVCSGGRRARHPTHVPGPDSRAIHDPRDLKLAVDFYERDRGLKRTASWPPGVAAFGTSPIHFAVREPLPAVDRWETCPASAPSRTSSESTTQSRSS